MYDKELILKSIENSGFPFEIECSERFRKLGFSVKPSVQFYDFIRNKNTEMDIIATKTKSVKTNTGHTIHCVLTLAIECKKYSSPVITFDAEDDNVEEVGNLDWDYRYCHINTSRDKSPNYFSVPIFDSESTNINVKASHHHFQSKKRNYNITQIEKVEKPNKVAFYKLSNTDDLRYSITKLGLYAYNFHKKWFANINTSKNNYEKLITTPVINILFLLFVHSGEQFQYDLSSKDIYPQNHSSVFSNVDLESDSISFVIDLVKIDDIDAAIKKITLTYDNMLKHLVKWFLAQKSG